MGFFKRSEKRLAKKTSTVALAKNYEASEQRLKAAARRGDMRGLRKEMKVHHKYEYAMLCQQTPKYRKKKK